MLNWIVTDHQPGDGTNYTFHIMKHTYGGYLVCCNDSSMWLAFADGEIKHLCGNDNLFTQIAIHKYFKGLNL